MKSFAVASDGLKRCRQVLVVLSASIIYFLLSAPYVWAQDPPGTAAAKGFVATLNEVILFPLIALLMGVAFLMFIVGAAEYIMGANNPAAREKGVTHLTYGIIGLVVMVSAWAILSLAVGTFGLDEKLDDLSTYETSLVVPFV